MGKKGHKDTALGRTLVKEKFGKKIQFSRSVRHTTELKDGQDWGRLNLQSITEQTNIDDFLSTAELAGTEFQAEKLNINFVPRSTLVGVLSEDEKIQVKNAQNLNRKMLRIPRRPSWDITTTPDELEVAERENFLSWRRDLCVLQEVEGIILTPFEKNLQFWRQLWRVIEKSDVVCQIVDGRNPLLFRCEDLENYVKELCSIKQNLLIVNKSDFLTDNQRQCWADYFRSQNIDFVFFSALETDVLDEIVEEEEELDIDPKSDLSDEAESDTNDCTESIESEIDNLTINAQNIATISQNSVSEDILEHDSSTFTNNLSTPKLLNRTELIEVFKTMHNAKKVNDNHVTIGLVGYPNVGKSSTINSLMKEKKTSVSATPGKTKHFQTLYLSEDLLLCDCPGLVFPGFVSTKAEMVVSGILPIDQMKDHLGPINTVCSLIPRNVFENEYGINIPLPQEGHDPNRPPTSEELLDCYGYMRQYMTQRGVPDNPRASRYILKDYMNGRLLYCHAPPSYEQDEFQTYILKKKTVTQKRTPQLLKAIPEMKKSDMLDATFFKPRFHTSGIKMISASSTSINNIDCDLEPVSKPWKKHNNHNKREKGRRKFSHLDY